MSKAPQKATNGVLSMFQHEAASGVLLLAAATLALILSNSPLSYVYDLLLRTPVGIRVGALGIDKPLLLWINDGLMAIFFLLVGLEIKRELLAGELSSFDRAILPAVAALGGMVVPALIYILVTKGELEELRGWAIPSATDIAFALGVLAVLGSRVPASLRLFLLALAIIDDLGAIVIIAIFYTANLSTTSLALAGVGALGLLALNLRGVARIAPYAIIGLFIWVCVLKSGVHATLAGVVMALAIPLRVTGATPYSPLVQLEHSLSPWVSFGVLPIFAFANAGVSLSGLSLSDVVAPVPLGIALGLFLGKQIGIFGTVWLAVRAKLAPLPQEATWRQVYGVALLGGIGFTMSLFIGTLAFPDPASAAEVRIGVLGGSLISAVMGYLVLRYGASGSRPASA